VTSKRLCAEVERLQKDIQQGLEDLQASLAHNRLTAEKSTGKSKLRAEQYIEGLEEDVETQKRLIVNTNDILVNMHSEFEAECKKKIEQQANALNDPSSWHESMPPAEVQANAQPEPLVSPSDPITYSGGAEPCECKSQMVVA
jgi:hypothetical protein